MRGHVQAEDRVRPSGSRGSPARSSSSRRPPRRSGGVSSAGWKMNFTVPGICARMPGQHLGHAHQDRGVRVVPAGVHHAAVLPVPLGALPCSRTARRPPRSPAARPCRRAAPRPGPGMPPLSTPTTPVCATFSRTSSKPSARRCSATMPAVRNSRLPSSGFWWKSRRQATTLGSTRSAAAAIARVEGGRGYRERSWGTILRRERYNPDAAMDHLEPEAGLRSTSRTTRTRCSSTAAARWSTCSSATRWAR